MANLSNINNKLVLTTDGAALINQGTVDYGTAKLQVSGNGSTGTITWRNDGGRKTGYLYSDSTGVAIYTTALNNAGIYLADNLRIDFRVNGSERMRIDSAGEVQARRPRSNTAGEVALGIQPSDTTAHYGWRIDQTNNSLNLDYVNTPLNIMTYSYLGNVGIGTASPSARLNVVGVGQANNPTVAIDVTNSDSFNHGLEIFDGNLTTGETVLMAIGHSGSTKLTAIFGFVRNESSLDQNLATIGFWGADNKLTVAAGGNVGIGTGTAVPGAKLDVRGTGNFLGTAASGAALVTIENNSGSTATSYGLLVKGGGNSASGKTFEVRDDSGNTDLIVKGNGNIAIGGLAATAKLQINANIEAGAATIAAFLVNSSITVGTEVRLAFAANTNDDIATNRYSYISTINTSGSNGQDMLFATNTTGNPAAARMRINSAGDVGIGTTPETSGPTWRTLFVGASATIVSRQAAAGYDSIFANNYYVNSSNQDRVRTTGPSSRMFLDGNNIRFQISPSTGAGGSPTWSEIMRIDDSENVGIGSTSPAGKLTVEGLLGTAAYGKSNGGIKNERMQMAWYTGQFYANNTAYTHIKTNLHMGGGARGNDMYIMGGFIAKSYGYGGQGYGEGRCMFHNWSGSFASLYVSNVGDWATFMQNPYVSSDGYCVIVLRHNYYSTPQIDFFQEFTAYPWRAVSVTAQGQSSSNTGLY